MSLTIGLGGSAFATAAESKLNMYLNYALPVDLRKVFTMTDVDISQALGTPLVRVGKDGSLTSGLAERWEIDPAGAYIDFHLNPRARWSDGSPISSAEVIASFRDAKAHYPKTLASLFESYDKMEQTGPGILRVHVKSGVKASALIIRFTEPMYGLVKLINWSASTSVTSGPYFVKSVNEKELILSVNRHWVFYKPEMISEIHIRRSNTFVNAGALLTDPWPDMVNLITGATKQEIENLPATYTTFKMNHDRLLNLRYIGHGNLDEVRTLFGYLRSHADFSKIANLFQGGLVAKQFYAPGLALHGKDPENPKVTKEQLLHAWKKDSVKIAYMSNRMQPEIKEALEKLLKDLIPFKVEFTGLNAQDIAQAHLSRKYDLMFASVGVDVQNFDGGMSYYIENEPAHIPSDKTAKGNFIARLKASRHSPADQKEAFRQILFDAVDGNYFLPIAHFSTTYIGRTGVDFSSVPKFGESMPYWAIRRSK